jgi:hypothetical protein
MQGRPCASAGRHRKQAGHGHFLQGLNRTTPGAETEAVTPAENETFQVLDIGWFLSAADSN